MRVGGDVAIKSGVIRFLCATTPSNATTVQRDAALQGFFGSYEHLNQAFRDLARSLVSEVD